MGRMINTMKMLNNNLPIDMGAAAVRWESVYMCVSVCESCKAVMCRIVHFPFCRAFVLHLTHWHNDYCCACVHNKHEWFSAISSFNASCDLVTIHHFWWPCTRSNSKTTRVFMFNSAAPRCCSYQFIIRTHTHAAAHCPCYRKWLRVFLPFHSEKKRYFLCVWKRKCDSETMRDK